MSEAPIVVISGLPGAGKSTTARALAQRFDRAAHVEADRLQELIVTGGVWPDADGIGPEAQDQLDLRLHHACLLARSFSAAGFAAVVDDIVIGPSVDRLAGLLGDNHRFVMLLPDFEHVRQRWLEMGSPFADRWDWIDRTIRHETTRRGLWLDTTQLTVDQAVDRIVDHLVDTGSGDASAFGTAGLRGSLDRNDDDTTG